jgi:hypothetical protein
VSTSRYSIAYSKDTHIPMTHSNPSRTPRYSEQGICETMFSYFCHVRCLQALRGILTEAFFS